MNPKGSTSQKKVTIDGSPRPGSSLPRLFAAAMHDADVLRARYIERRPELMQVARDLTAETEGILEDLPHIDRISYRVKGVDQFVEKGCGKPGLAGYQEPLREVEDQVAGRILVFFRGDLEPVMSAICKEFSSVELRRKAPRTTEFGYESDHSIFVIPPQ